MDAWSMICQIYHEGGPRIGIEKFRDPGTVQQLQSIWAIGKGIGRAWIRALVVRAKPAT